MYIVAFELSEPSSNAPDVLPVRIALARRAFDSDHSKSNYDDLASSLFFVLKWWPCLHWYESWPATL